MKQNTLFVSLFVNNYGATKNLEIEITTTNGIWNLIQTRMEFNYKHKNFNLYKSGAYTHYISDNAYIKLYENTRDVQIYVEQKIFFKWHIIYET